MTASSVTGDGTLRLDLNGSGTAIVDLAGDAIAGGYTAGQTYAIEHTPPSDASITVPTMARTAWDSGSPSRSPSASRSSSVDTAVAIGLGGGATAYADYVLGSGTNALVFDFTIFFQRAGPRRHRDRLEHRSNGGTIIDAATNAPPLRLGGMPDRRRDRQRSPPVSATTSGTATSTTTSSTAATGTTTSSQATSGATGPAAPTSSATSFSGNSTGAGAPGSKPAPGTTQAACQEHLTVNPNTVEHS